jgi:hypothetical protein
MLDRDTMLPEVYEWQQRGWALYARLIAEREALAALLANLDAAIATVTALISAPQPEQPVSQTVGSATALVRAILQHHPDGLTTPAIIREACRVRRRLNPSTIYSAVSRLANKYDMLVVHGTKRNRKYQLAKGLTS